MPAEIAEATGVIPELIRGQGGVFDVTVDGTLIFSKHQTGRFPDVGEIAVLIKD